ncbi:MAG: formylmethanofuran--tetrahydromethanopterin N-formyltransferase [Hadesarchaea archaeon]|nr:MAG: formylmethanofuran--tetrahydromethanopterin N-formyltransferase [Hadesarchaea archaeon]
MQVNGVEIEDTFAEAFGMRAARVIVTAKNEEWVRNAALTATGFATSVIACGAEAGVERWLSPQETPDGRPGASLLLFAMSEKDLEDQLLRRIGQCIMTCPTTSCFNGLQGEKSVKVGAKLRFFGDGFQLSKRLEGKRFWRIPVMEGEFLVEEEFGIKRAVGGGNFLILGEDEDCTLEAAERAVERIRKVEGVVAPFPGGVVRSGSKVGSKYKFLRASTNTEYCPTLRPLVKSKVPEGVNCVLEIVINGLDEESVRRAMRVGIEGACSVKGIKRISAGNYGGKLGKYLFYLREVMK